MYRYLPIAHLLLSAMFIYVPSQLIQTYDISLQHHGWVYLPLLLVSLFVAFPSIVLAEKYRKMRGIFLTAIAGIILVSIVYHFLGLNRSTSFYWVWAYSLLLLTLWKRYYLRGCQRLHRIQSKATAMPGCECEQSVFGSIFWWDDWWAIVDAQPHRNGFKCDCDCYNLAAC